MESFGHKMFISSQPVPLTGRGVLYPRVRDFFKCTLKFATCARENVNLTTGAEDPKQNNPSNF